MSADFYCASGNNASLHSTTVGDSKPLHRFIKGQPKIIGIIVLVLGSSILIPSITLTQDEHVQFMEASILSVVLPGTLFIISGILYILTEHNTTKKNVTASLALTIVTILGACWTIINILPRIAYHHEYYREYEYIEDNITEINHQHWSSYQDMEMSLDLIFLVYIVVGAIVLIGMSCLAVAALRSTKSQVIVVMTTTPAETPVE